MRKKLLVPVVILGLSVISTGCSSYRKVYNAADFVGVYVDTKNPNNVTFDYSKPLISLHLFEDSICEYREEVHRNSFEGIGKWSLAVDGNKAYIKLSFYNIEYSFIDRISGLHTIPGQRTFNVVNTTELTYRTQTFRKMSSDDPDIVRKYPHAQWFKELIKDYK